MSAPRRRDGTERRITSESFSPRFTTVFISRYTRTEGGKWARAIKVSRLSSLSPSELLRATLPMETLRRLNSIAGWMDGAPERRTRERERGREPTISRVQVLGTRLPKERGGRKRAREMVPSRLRTSLLRSIRRTVLESRVECRLSSSGGRRKKLFPPL